MEGPDDIETYSTVMVPTMPCISWGMQIRLKVPGLSKVTVYLTVSSASTETSMSRSSTVKVWNSLWEVRTKVIESPVLKLISAGEYT